MKIFFRMLAIGALAVVLLAAFVWFVAIRPRAVSKPEAYVQGALRPIAGPWPIALKNAVVIADSGFKANYHVYGQVARPDDGGPRTAERVEKQLEACKEADASNQFAWSKREWKFTPKPSPDFDPTWWADAKESATEFQYGDVHLFVTSSGEMFVYEFRPD